MNRLWCFIFKKSRTAAGGDQPGRLATHAEPKPVVHELAELTGVTFIHSADGINAVKKRVLLNIHNTAGERTF